MIKKFIVKITRYDKTCGCGEPATWMLWECRIPVDFKTGEGLRDGKGELIREIRKKYLCLKCARKIPKMFFVCGCYYKFETNDYELYEIHKEKYCSFKNGWY